MKTPRKQSWQSTSFALKRKTFHRSGWESTPENWEALPTKNTTPSLSPTGPRSKKKTQLWSGLKMNLILELSLDALTLSMALSKPADLMVLTVFCAEYQVMIASTAMRKSVQLALNLMFPRTLAGFRAIYGFLCAIRACKVRFRVFVFDKNFVFEFASEIL